MSIAERYSPKATRFSRRWRWILLGVVASGILIVGYRAGNHSNLVYQNHEIDYWIRELYNGKYYSWRLNAPPPNIPPRIALLKFGAKATPFLIREFEHTDSIVSRKLRPHLAGKSWLESFDITRFFDTPDLSHRRALEGFVCIGNEGKDAIPRLSYHLIHSSSRNLAAFALGFIGPESIPALLQGLSHKDPHIRTAAATGLQLISPAADPIIATLLNELDIEYDGRNSWTNRAYVRLTARELESDCYHTPAYPELGEVIKTRAPKAIRAATETALENFNAEQLLESRRTQSTQAFYSLSNQAEPCFRSFLTDQAIEEFFKEIKSVSMVYPELSFACDLLRLDILLWQERMEDISPFAERLKQQADQSWIKSRDLANVFVQGANRNRRFPRAHAIEAAETALSLAPQDYCQNLIRLCISAYGRQSNHPRVNELKTDSRYLGIQNPFLIVIPKAFQQSSLPPSSRVPKPSP